MRGGRRKEREKGFVCGALLRVLSKQESSLSFIVRAAVLRHNLCKLWLLLTQPGAEDRHGRTPGARCQNGRSQRSWGRATAVRRFRPITCAAGSCGTQNKLRKHRIVVRGVTVGGRCHSWREVLHLKGSRQLIIQEMRLHRYHSSSAIQAGTGCQRSIFPCMVQQDMGVTGKYIMLVSLVANSPSCITVSRGLNFPLPLASAAEQTCLSAAAQGYDRDDVTGLVRLFLYN